MLYLSGSRSEGWLVASLDVIEVTQKASRITRRKCIRE